MMAMGEEDDQNLLSSSGIQEQEEESNSRSVEAEENLVTFLDSMDGYLILMDSLSSTLRQGWLEIASARHSMGASRINSALLDLKYHSAATTLQVDHQHVGSELEQPLFMLHKWASSESLRSISEEGKFEDEKLLASKSTGPQIHNKIISENSACKDMQEKMVGNDGSPHCGDDQCRNRRLKSLSMFGALVSPKLRAAQHSFETALEILAEIANVRASLLCAYEVGHTEMKSTMN